jgi:hypothetical protein
MRHGFGQHPSFRVGPDVIVFVGILDIGDFVVSGGALPMRVAALIREYPFVAPAARQIGCHDLTAIQ